MKYDLSILIPARNEIFLSQTVINLLENIRGNTEIIVVLDGEWADPGVPDDPRVTIIYHSQSIGQRAATNEACRLSKAKYVMKIDAHCAVDEGFDVKLMETMEDDWTVLPAMYNLHGFNWKCGKCGREWYQSPSPGFCKLNEHDRNPDCGNTTDFERVIIWKPRINKKSLYFRFDKTLHFQYWGDYGRRPQAQGDIADILSIQGSCFFLTREKYWELNICDEKHGSWGQQGVEVACKTWLSGGRLVVNKKTWYSHMFRTQGGDFGFPYPLSTSDVEKAREYSRSLWLNNTWPLAKHDLNWLLDKFKPVPDWHDNVSAVADARKKGIIYYTDNKLNIKLANIVRDQIKQVNLPIISSSLKPLKFGSNVVLKLERGYLTMAKQILAALEASTAEIVFFCEHDVLYHQSHFEFTPKQKDVYYYNTNVWRVRASDGHALYCSNLQQLSGLCAYRKTLLEHFKKRVEKLEEIYGFDMNYGSAIYSENEKNRLVREIGFEPGTHNRSERIDELKAESYFSQFPNLDIRHENNLTPSRWNKKEFRNDRYTKGWTEGRIKMIDGWPQGAKDFQDFLSYL